MTGTEYAGRMGRNRKPAGDDSRTTRDIVPGFAGMVAAALTARGWSYQQLADAAGVSLSTVSKVVRERGAPSLRVASAMVAALGLVVFLHDPARPIGPATTGDR